MTSHSAAAPDASGATGLLLLRAPGSDLHAELTWPAVSGPQLPPAALVLTGNPRTGAAAVAEAAARAGVLVVTASAASQLPGSSEYLLGWLADHASDVGADPSRLVLAGLGAAAFAAAAVARRASAEGWPQVSRLLIVLPQSTAGLRPGPGASAGLGSVTAILPATAAVPADLQALAAAGVPVRIRRIPPGPRAGLWRSAAAAVAADLADLPAPRAGARPRPHRRWGGPLLRWPPAAPPAPASGAADDDCGEPPSPLA